MPRHSGHHVSPVLKAEKARALSHLVQNLCHASDPVTQAVVRRHMPEFAVVNDALDACEAIDAALLADELDDSAEPVEVRSAC
jgi:hypothetical protein